MMFSPESSGTERKRPAATSARMRRPTRTSSCLRSLGSVSETRSVSPMPRASSFSKAIRVLISPIGGSPASVTPRCSGTSGRSRAKRSFASTTFAGSESLSETTKFVKPNPSSSAQWSTAQATIAPIESPG